MFSPDPKSGGLFALEFDVDTEKHKILKMDPTSSWKLCQKS